VKHTAALQNVIAVYHSFIHHIRHVTSNSIRDLDFTQSEIESSKSSPWSPGSSITDFDLDIKSVYQVIVCHIFPMYVHIPVVC